MSKIRETLKDRRKRTLLLSAGSMLIGLFYAAYNMFLGFSYGSTFAMSIFTYYIFITALRLHIIVFEYRHLNQNIEDAERKRKTSFIICSIFMFLIVFSLLAPITIMGLHKKVVNYSMIPAIAIAAYTTYKVVMCIHNYRKSRKLDNLSIKQLRTINIVDTCLSIISLQYTLLSVTGGLEHDDMIILSSITSLVLTLVMIFFTIYGFAREMRIMKKAEKEN